MSKTDITLVGTDPYGKKASNKISYVNPDATNNQITAFASLIGGITSNQINQVNKIETTELSMIAKEDRNIANMQDKTYTKAEIFTALNDGGFIGITNLPVTSTTEIPTDTMYCPKQPDGVAPYISYNSSGFPFSINIMEFGQGDIQEAYCPLIGFCNQTSAADYSSLIYAGKCVITIPETDLYKGYTFTITITE